MRIHVCTACGEAQDSHPDSGICCDGCECRQNGQVSPEDWIGQRMVIDRYVFKGYEGILTQVYRNSADILTAEIDCLHPKPHKGTRVHVPFAWLVPQKAK